MEANSNNTTTIKNFTSNGKSYSSVVTHSNASLPTKDQAIVFTSLDGLRIQDYLLELGPIVNPKNIIFCSRISNNRICIYLSEKKHVDDFLNDYGEITINGTKIPARRLITPSERLLLSNVSPTIPNDILIDILQNLGLKLMSPITSLRIGATDPAYSHILSFRRQIYISPPENIVIPDYIELEQDDVQYRIFLSRENHRCFKCKQVGHNASQCVTQTEVHPNLSCTQLAPPSGNTASEQQPIQSSTPTHSQECMETETTANKRPVSEILSPTPEDATNVFATPQEKVNKKHKHENTSSGKSIQFPEAIKDFIDNHSPPFSLNSQQLEKLLDDTHGTRDVLITVKDYTSNPSTIVTILEEVHPHLTDRRLKIRCTKLKSKLTRQLETGTLNTDSDSSTY